jgi:hypothetical protein
MSQLWDIRQSVRTLAEDIVRIRYQQTTSEDIEESIYVLQLQWCLELVNQWGFTFTCSYELGIVFNKSSYQSKPRL